jgi:hypothetical protein
VIPNANLPPDISSGWKRDLATIVSSQIEAKQKGQETRLNNMVSGQTLVTTLMEVDSKMTIELPYFGYLII